MQEGGDCVSTIRDLDLRADGRRLAVVLAKWDSVSVTDWR